MQNTNLLSSCPTSYILHYGNPLNWVWWLNGWMFLLIAVFSEVWTGLFSCKLGTCGIREVVHNCKWNWPTKQRCTTSMGVRHDLIGSMLWVNGWLQYVYINVHMQHVSQSLNCCVPPQAVEPNLSSYLHQRTCNLVVSSVIEFTYSSSSFGISVSALWASLLIKTQVSCAIIYIGMVIEVGYKLLPQVDHFPMNSCSFLVWLPYPL